MNYKEAVPIGLIWMPRDGTIYVAVRLSSRIFMPLKDLVQGTIGAHYLVVVISKNEPFVIELSLSWNCHEMRYWLRVIQNDITRIGRIKLPNKYMQINV